MASPPDLDVDAVIDKLLEVRGNRPGKLVNLTEQEVRSLCRRERETHCPAEVRKGAREENAREERDHLQGTELQVRCSLRLLELRRFGMWR